jgi:hypothetical protein
MVDPTLYTADFSVAILLKVQKIVLALNMWQTLKSYGVYNQSLERSIELSCKDVRMAYGLTRSLRPIHRHLGWESR